MGEVPHAGLILTEGMPLTTASWGPVGPSQFRTGPRGRPREGSNWQQGLGSNRDNHCPHMLPDPVILPGYERAALSFRSTRVV